jgi:predicted transcriptional regulator
MMEPTVTITIADRAEVKRHLAGAFEGKKQASPGIVFESYELMAQILTPKRVRIISAMMGAGPLALREVARRVHRDVHGVHTDVHALVNAGVVCRAGEGFEFPYGAVHLDATLTPAEAAE